MCTNDIASVGYKFYNDDPEVYRTPHGAVLHCSINPQFSSKLNDELILDVYDRLMKSIFGTVPNVSYPAPYRYYAEKYFNSLKQGISNDSFALHEVFYGRSLSSVAMG